MPEPVPVITLDGPSGVGKGTICLKTGRRLGWHILDSGSLYRLTALRALRRPDQASVLELVDIANNIDVRYEDEYNQMTIYLEDENVTDIIRNEEVGDMASKIAAIKEVRVALFERQRAFALPPGLVADGRDMGTVVFPEASLKIFLTASPEERAKRRYNQLIEKGISVNLPDLVNELQERDARDTKRATAPLKAAPDAVVIDTTHLAIDQVTDQVMDLVKQRFG